MLYVCLPLAAALTTAHVAPMPRVALSPMRTAGSFMKEKICVDEICPPEDFDIDDLKPLVQAVAPPAVEGLGYAEDSRKFRRTVYMHDEWVRHRSSDRFFTQMKNLGKSGVGKNLATELGFSTGTASFVVLMNMLLIKYQDLSGASHPGPLADFWPGGAFSLPAMPFTIAMPALSLLLVFRTNTGYARWNEARTLWGGIVNTCRNIARQANQYYPDTPEGNLQRDRIAGTTAGFAKCLRNFLRGPSDDPTLRLELQALADAGLIPPGQVDACMAAKNRAMFMVSAISANLRGTKGLDAIDRSRMDVNLNTLVDITGACERIFKSPVPLIYTRHTARFLTSFIVLLPFALFEATGGSWNHITTIPMTTFLAFFLFGIEEIGIQIEEPFSILPLEALCDGAIEATMNEMTSAETINSFAFDDYYTESLERARFLMQAGDTYQQHERNLQQHNESPE